MSEVAVPMKRDYEVAVDAFNDADKAFRDLETEFWSGEWIPDPAAREEFQAMKEVLETTLEDRNRKLQNAAHQMRQAVVLTETQQRGPEGKASILSYGGMTVTSVTKRWLDPGDLLAGLKRKDQEEGTNYYGELLARTARDKDGKEYKLVETKTEIDYNEVRAFLIDNNLQAILETAYDEKESTPQVKGAKPLAFLGQKVEK